MAAEPSPQFVGMPIGRIDAETTENTPVERHDAHEGRPMFYQDKDKQHDLAIVPLAGTPRDNTKPNSNIIASMRWEPQDSKFIQQQRADASWPVQPGEISDVWVREDHRRRGLATFMLGYGRAMAESDPSITTPVHSSHRSTVGDKWAQSTGDPLPKRRFPER